MERLEHILKAASCLGEFIAALQIEAAMLGKGRLPPKTAAAAAIGVWCITQFIWGGYTAFSVTAISFNALRFFLASLLFGGGVLYKIASVVVSGAIVLGYSSLLGSLMGQLVRVPLSESWNVPISPLIYGIVLNALVFLLLRTVKPRLQFVESEERIAGICYSCVIVILIILLICFGQTTGQYGWMFLIAIGLFLLVAVFLGVFLRLGLQVLRANRASYFEKIQKERADAFSASYQVQRRLTHEFTNHMDALQIYLENENIEEAKKYIASIMQQVSQGSTVVNTNNPMVDALLSKKYHDAQDAQVMLSFDLCDLKDFPLRQSDLVTVLCNLLDNAISAASMANPPQIFLRVRKLNDEYVVSVRNRVLKDVQIGEKGLPVSTKKEPGHGIGLSNVRDIILRHKGEYTIRCKNQWFSFTFTVPEADCYTDCEK